MANKVIYTVLTFSFGGCLKRDEQVNYSTMIQEFSVMEYCCVVRFIS